MNKLMMGAVAAAFTVLLPAPAIAADQDIYGYQLMTPAERTAHRDKMRQAKTAEEREQIRAAHHAEMQIRAKQKGLTLPDMPANRGPGSGPGGGAGRQ